MGVDSCSQVHYDPLIISQSDLLAALAEAEASLPSSVESLTFPGRRITFPIVLDDRWNREALERYMRSIRQKAVYLPSNVEYLAKNNGLESAKEALELLVRTDWVCVRMGLRDGDANNDDARVAACARRWLLSCLPLPCPGKFSIDSLSHWVLRRPTRSTRAVD